MFVSFSVDRKQSSLIIITEQYKKFLRHICQKHTKDFFFLMKSSKETIRHLGEIRTTKKCLYAFTVKFPVRGFVNFLTASTAEHFYLYTQNERTFSQSHFSTEQKS